MEGKNMAPLSQSQMGEGNIYEGDNKKSIRAAGAEITGKVKKTAEGLEKLTKTLKKQKDIIDK